VVVREVNRLPTLAGATNTTILEMVAYTQALAPVDPDIPAQPLTVTLLSGPAGLVVTGGVLAWTPSENQGPSTNTVAVRVSDGVGSVTNSFVVVVRELGVNDIEPGKEAYMAIFAPKPVVLDGELTEWSDVPVITGVRFAVPKGSGSTLVNPNYVLFETYNGGTWSGPEDHATFIQITFDSENVYVGCLVMDDSHENGAGSSWNGDSLQIMIATGDRQSQIALYNYALGGLEGAAGGAIILHEAGPGGQPECGCVTEAVIKRDAASRRTVYEIKLPKAALGLASLRGGPKFGLGIAVNDGDNEPGQEGQKGWSGLGPHAIVFGKSPRETAEITLSPEIRNTLPSLGGATNMTIPELVGHTQNLAPADVDIPVQSLTVTLVSGPTGLVVTNGVLAWTPTEAQGSSTNTVVVTVADGVGTVTNSFSVVVREVNALPSLAGATNATINELVGYTQPLVPQDVDIPVQSLTVTLVSGPTGLVVTNGVLAWTPTEVQGPSTNSVVVTVSDGVGTTTNTFAITVREVNVLPTLAGATNATINELVGYMQSLAPADEDVPMQPLTVSLV